MEIGGPCKCPLVGCCEEHLIHSPSNGKVNKQEFFSLSLPMTAKETMMTALMSEIHLKALAQGWPGLLRRPQHQLQGGTQNTPHIMFRM